MKERKMAIAAQLRSRGRKIKAAIFCLLLFSFFFAWLDPAFLTAENLYSRPPANFSRAQFWQRLVRLSAKQKIRLSKNKKTEELIRLPDVKFYLFGMGNRRKFLYRDGMLFDALTSKIVRQWQVTNETILPSRYTVRLETSDGKKITITEDEQAVWLQDGIERVSLTKGFINLAKFQGHTHASLLRVLLQEILINIVDTKPVPNFFVYSKPWYRDAAMVAMCLEKTNNLHLIKPWIIKLHEPFDRNNAGYEEPDNLGQVLYLISLVSESSHPLVEKVLGAIPRFQKDKYVVGKTDFSEHPVYQTKWLKLGLGALGLADSYEIPAVFDSYSALFWMDFKDAHVPGQPFSEKAKSYYPYLAWAEAHFHSWPPPMPLEARYPTTWEAHASAVSSNRVSCLKL